MLTLLFQALLNDIIYITSDVAKRLHPVFHKGIFHAGIYLKANYEIVNAIAKAIIAMEGCDARARNFIVIQQGNGIEISFIM